MFHLAVISAMWGRDELAALMLDNLSLRKRELEKRMRLSVVVAHSEGMRTQRLIESRGAIAAPIANKPLGRKWQTAMNRARTLNPDAVIVLGSDNIVNVQLLRCWAAQFELGRDYVGLRDALQFNPHRGTLIHWPGYVAPKKQGKPDRSGEPIGSSRAFSRRLLDVMDGQIWDQNANRGLDFSTTLRLNEIRHDRLILRQTDGDMRHLGIKVSGAMSPSLHGHTTSRHMKAELLLDWFGQEIGERILALRSGRMPRAAAETPGAGT